MSFLIYDLGFLVIFSLAVGIFLYAKRKKLVKEGWMYLYKTSIGLDSMNYLGKKHPRVMRFFSYVIVLCGYLLMLAAFYMIASIIYLFTKPEFVKVVKIPPITPLIPYLPELFKINWLPPFYFTYWIIAIALVAIFHEGFHGIFMRFYNVRIKSSGFGFLGPFLAFFVEQDDKQLRKAKPFNQQAILAAGVFANVLLGIIFFILMAVFFSSAYSPAGVVFQDYIYSDYPSTISSNLTLLNETLQVDGFNVTKVEYENRAYFINSELLTNTDSDYSIRLYYDYPALRSQMRGAIISINDEPIKANQDIANITRMLKPGDVINITTEYKENNTYSNQIYEIKLGADYTNRSRAIIGIVSIAEVRGGTFRTFLGNLINSFRDPNVYYKTKINEEFTLFIYTLLWWIFVINISVAVANMLPVGIFDGGRFFYLAVLLVTKKERIAAKAFKFMTWLFLAILALSMALWIVGLLWK